MKKVFIALALIASLSANAQKIHRNQWGLQPRVGISSFALWGILFNVESNLLDAAGVSEMDADDYSEFWARNSWYIPEIDFSYPINYISQTCRCKLSTPRVVEKWMFIVLGSIKSMLSHICRYKIEDVLIKRYTSFLTAFAKEFCKIWFRCSDRGWCQICQFLCPRTCIIQDRENSMITPPTRSREINAFQ